MSLKPLGSLAGGLLPGFPPPPPNSAPRSRDRAAQWRADLARSYGYLMGQARHDGEREAIDAEYHRLLAEGPDFARVRRKSGFMDAPAITLDRNARARLRIRFRAVMRNSWSTKAKGKHRGIVSRTAESVFEALLYLAEKHGRVFPSLDGLAFMAKCCKQSVVTALADLERLGFITRHRRRKRVRGPFGTENRQDSNAYEIHEPINGWGRLAMRLFVGSSESNKPPAREPKIKTYNEEVRIFALEQIDVDPWASLKREWEAT